MHGDPIEFFDFVREHRATDDSSNLEHLFRQLGQIPLLGGFDPFGQAHHVSHFQTAPFSGPGHLTIQTLPDSGFVGSVDVLGSHPEAAVHVGVVLVHEGLEHIQVLIGVGRREVTVQTSLEGAIITFGDGGFSVPQGEKMSDAFLLQPPLDGGIIEFFALVRL